MKKLEKSLGTRLHELRRQQGLSLHWQKKRLVCQYLKHDRKWKDLAQRDDTATNCSGIGHQYYRF